MKIELDLNIDGINKINSYSIGNIVVSDTVYNSSLILSPEIIISDWPPENIFQMKLDDLEQLINLNPELVILGTGAKLHLQPETITMYFHSRNIGFEVMDTGAACRAFNFLIAEGRDVVAAMFMIED